MIPEQLVICIKRLKLSKFSLLPKYKSRKIEAYQAKSGADPMQNYTKLVQFLFFVFQNCHLIRISYCM